MDSLGKQDGNAGYPVVPVGRTDIDRTLARIPGMKLLAYSEKNDGRDRIITVKLRFDTMDALIGFMDASGEKAVYSGERNTKKLTFTVVSARPNRNADMNVLLRRVSQGYSVNFTMSFPTEGKAAVQDGAGLSLNTQGSFSGKKVSCSLPLETVLLAQNGIRLEFSW